MITTCQHCNTRFEPGGIETFCSPSCAHQHLQSYYEAYGWSAPPSAESSHDFYQAARDRGNPDILS